MQETENRERSCEERIDEELASRVEWFKELVKGYDDQDADDYDEKEAALHESPLAVSDRVVRRVELSYGGPQDYLMVTYDSEGEEIESIRYHFLDWFDGASRELGNEELDAAEAYVNRLVPPPAELR